MHLVEAQVLPAGCGKRSHNTESTPHRRQMRTRAATGPQHASETRLYEVQRWCPNTRPHHKITATGGFLAHHHDNVCNIPQRQVVEENDLIPDMRSAPDTQHATIGATKYYRPQTDSSPVALMVKEEW